MEFWLAPVTEIPAVIVELAAKARPELALKAMQPVARRSVAENLPERDLPVRLGPEVLARRLARPARVFVAPVLQRPIPSRAQLGRGRSLYSYRSNHRWSAPSRPPRAQSSKARRVFSPASLRSRFRAARGRSRRGRLCRKAQREARPLATWTKERANGQPGEEIRCRPFQLTNFKDSIKRGSRTGKSDALATTRR